MKTLQRFALSGLLAAIVIAPGWAAPSVPTSIATPGIMPETKAGEVKRLQEKIKLDAPTADKLYDLMNGKLDDMRAQVLQQHLLKQKLVETLRDPASTEEQAMTISRKLAENSQQTLETRIHQLYAIKQLLTPEQYQAFQKFRKEDEPSD